MIDFQTPYEYWFISTFICHCLLINHTRGPIDQLELGALEVLEKKYFAEEHFDAIEDAEYDRYGDRHRHGGYRREYSY